MKNRADSSCINHAFGVSVCSITVNRMMKKASDNKKKRNWTTPARRYICTVCLLLSMKRKIGPLCLLSVLHTHTLQYLIPSIVSTPLSEKKPPVPRCSRRLRRRSPWACCSCANASAIRTVVGNAKYNADAAYTRARRSPPRPRCARPRRRGRSRRSGEGAGSVDGGRGVARGARTEGSPGTFGAPPHNGPGPPRGGREATREVCAGCPASPCYWWIFWCADG